MTEEKLTMQDQILQCVTFDLHGESYALDAVRVREMLRGCALTPVAGTPEYVLGVIDLRGKAVVVIDACARLGLQHTETTEMSRILVLEASGRDVGILVDGVGEIVEIRHGDLAPSHGAGCAEAARFIEGIASCGNESFYVVDIARLLGEEEWAEFETL